MLKHNPIFLLNFVLFATCILFSAKVVFCWRQPLLETPPLPKTPLSNENVYFWFSLLTTETPMFVVFTIYMITKKWHFPKQTVSTEMPFFHLPNTNRVLQFFSEMPIFTKWLSPPNPNNTIVLDIFAISFFWFLLFSLSFSNKKGKTKNAIFVSKAPFLTSRHCCENTILAPLHTICNFKHTKNTINWGISGFWLLTWTNSWLMKPQILDQFWLYSIYMYVYIFYI